MELRTGLELIRKAGFDGVDLWVGDVPWFQIETANDTTATALFLGDNDWPAIRVAMKKIGYDGWLIAEPIPRYHFARDQQFYHVSVALDRFVAGAL